MKRRFPWLLPTVVLLLVAAVPRQAIQLRNLGLAQLENEQAAEAEATFKRLTVLTPDDPLGYANAAIAALRQHNTDSALEWIAPALQKRPDDPDLLAIQAEILQWAGRPKEALATLLRAARAATDSPHIQYAAYRQALTAGDDAAGDEILTRLVALRPENLYIVLERGRRAIAAGDRAVATASFLRVRELLWQAPPQASAVLDQLLDALEANDVPAARVPGLRLTNVLKVTPMFQQGLRDLTLGIQGDPLLRFLDEPPVSDFGDPVPVVLRGESIDRQPVGGHTIALGDFDEDGRADFAWVAPAGDDATEGTDADPIHLLLSTQGRRRLDGGARGTGVLRTADLDNDGHLDLIDLRSGGVEIWQGEGSGGFTAAGEALGLSAATARTGVLFDFDAEGDLDLLVAPATGGLELYRNPGAGGGALEPVGAHSLPAFEAGPIEDLIASDLDRDGDLDIVVAHDNGLTWLLNQRQGLFVDHTEAGGLRWAPASHRVVSADLDNDGWPDLVAAGKGIHFFHNVEGRFEIWAIGEQLRTQAEFLALTALDADNDGRQDLAVGGGESLVVLTQRDDLHFDFLEIAGGPGGVLDLAARDLDGDGDLDLLAGGAAGLSRLDNDGGNRNHWLAVSLRGLLKGSSKNNHRGLGSTVEARVGDAYQWHEVTSDVTHLGLGSRPQADVLRVVWSNGVPQNRLDARADQQIVEEQVLKGSCPFLYAWDGERIRFVSDLLWGAPIGMPVAAGVWAGADPRELVLVEGAVPKDGGYDLRLTEELWESAYIDLSRLWIVDLPDDLEAASSLRILPGRMIEDRVLASRDLRTVARAWDGAGHDVTSRVARRDDIYAAGYATGPYQGVAAAPWSFTFDLGAAPAAPIRLHLEGWIFPADASLNLAVDQRPGPPGILPRLEVETPAGWQVLMPEMGFPAGKTKTMVVDTPPLPAGASRLRIVSTLWLAWDRIAWTTSPVDDEVEVRARLTPAAAHLHHRGFSAPLRRAPNAPHEFDYARVRTESPWLPIGGPFTRYGDVVELLAEQDDRSVVLAPGDEIVLGFDASHLPPPAPGHRRIVLLESFGWDKDADRNTFAADQVEPLPFAAMTGYPYGAGEAFPDTPLLRAYRAEWLTRYPPTAPR